MGYQGMATHSKTKFKNKCLLKIRLSSASGTLQCSKTLEKYELLQDLGEI